MPAAVAEAVRALAARQPRQPRLQRPGGGGGAGGGEAAPSAVPGGVMGRGQNNTRARGSAMKHMFPALAAWMIPRKAVVGMGVGGVPMGM